MNIEGKVFNGGKDFAGVYDVLSGEITMWSHTKNTLKENSCKEYRKTPINPTQVDLFSKYKNAVVDQILDYSDELAERFLETEDYSCITNQEILAVLKTQLENKSDLLPVVCGSSLGQIGVQNLLDTINLLLPGPIVHEERLNVGQVFKLVHTGPKRNIPTAYFRTYSGNIQKGSMKVCSPITGKVISSNAGQVYIPQASSIKSTDKIGVGQIGLIKGAYQIQAGDFIIQGKTDDPIKSIEKFSKKSKAPESLMFMSVEPDSDKDHAVAVEVFSRLSQEDPSLSITVDEENDQIVLGMQGKLHSEVIKSRVERENKLDLNYGPLLINYHERCHNWGSDKFAGESRGIELEIEIETSANDSLVDVNPTMIEVPMLALDAAIRKDGIALDQSDRTKYQIATVIKQCIVRKLANGPIAGKNVRLPKDSKIVVNVKKLGDVEEKVTKRGQTIQVKVDDGKIGGLKQAFIKGTRISRTALQSAVNLIFNDIYGKLNFNLFGPVVDIEIVTSYGMKQKISEYLVSSHHITDLEEHSSNENYVVLTGQLNLKSMETLSEDLRRIAGGDVSLSSNHAGYNVTSADAID